MKRLRVRYGQRVWLLGVVAVLLICLLWKQRLVASLHLWKVRDELASRLNGPDDRSDRMAMLYAELAALDSALGNPEVPADEVWRRALGYTASAANGAALNGVDLELVLPLEGRMRHLLPVTVKGGFTELLRTANGLQQTVREAHVISMRFHAQRDPMTRRRSLLLTLYLQTITDEKA